MRASLWERAEVVHPGTLVAKSVKDRKAVSVHGSRIRVADDVAPVINRAAEVSARGK